MGGIVLQNVSLRFGRRDSWVLNGVSGVLPSGTVTVVTGRTGAGKTTLLKVLAGVLPATRGAVVGRPPVVGWVPERFPADQFSTIRQYLTHSGRMRGLRSSSPAIEHWAERLSLTPYLDTKLPELSRGTAQKVGLAQALLVPPGLLVLDEPWEGLDPGTQEELPGLMADVTAAGGVCVVSDHRGEIAALRPDAEWHLAEGRLTMAPGVGSLTGRRVVEVLVDDVDADALVAALRKAGHEIRSVRPAEVSTG